MGCLLNLQHSCLFVSPVVLVGMLVRGASSQSDVEYEPDADVMHHSPPPPRSSSASAECISGGRLPRQRVVVQVESLRLTLRRVLATAADRNCFQAIEGSLQKLAWVLEIYEAEEPLLLETPEDSRDESLVLKPSLSSSSSILVCTSSSSCCGPNEAIFAVFVYKESDV